MADSVSTPVASESAKRFTAGGALAGASTALFLLFITVVLPGIFPVRLLQPSWLLRFAAALATASPLALTGLALLQVAVAVSPGEEQIKKRFRLFARLAVLAALGFLILLPLQGFALLRQTAILNEVRVSRIERAEQQLNTLRGVVDSATSSEQLNIRLQEVNGPVLGPADRSQPLPLLKAQVGAVLDQAAIQIRKEREANPVVGRLALLPDLMRIALTNAALAFGFASLGRRPGSKQSPISELQSAWQRNTRRRSSRPRSPLKSLRKLLARYDIHYWR